MIIFCVFLLMDDDVMMGNDGWMIDDVFLVLQCLLTPESSTLTCQNGTRRESRI